MDNAVQKSGPSRVVIITVLVCAFIIAVGLAVGLAIGLSDDCDDRIPVPIDGDSKEIKSGWGSYKYAAVVTDAEICSQIGNNVLARQRGNAIDATVAALLCVGVVQAHSTGIGGGSFYTVYHKATDTFYSLVSRETAPAAATENMFAAEEDRIKSTVGGLATGVPGEVLGLYELHRRLGSGSITWNSLVQPTVQLCEEGVPLSVDAHKALDDLPNKTAFAPYFAADNSKHPVGTKIKLPELAQTFREIANDPYSFYNGSLADLVVEDIREEGGIITRDDLVNYSVNWYTPTKLDLPGGLEVYSIPPPGSGVVLSYILGILSGYNMSPANIANTDSEILTYHRVIEAFKFAYAKRSELGDGHTENVANMTSRDYCEETRQQIDDDRTHSTEYYNPTFDMQEDAGTSHLSIIDGDGNAVGATSTINLYFGAKYRGRRTGIVFNNEMDDFSTPNTTNYFGLPASPANFIEPGKRPQSSMCPAVVFDTGKRVVRMVSGAQGGTKITTSTAMNIVDVLWLGVPVTESVDRPRVHHQLVPVYVEAEKAFSQTIIDGLKVKGHEVVDMSRGSVVQSLDVTNTELVGVSDWRKGGAPDGY